MDQANQPDTSGVVRSPQQARSARTLARLEAAALRLIREEGLAGLSIQGVVKEAGSSVGSFYARFGSKDDLLEYLRSGARARALDAWAERAADLSQQAGDLEALLPLMCAAVVATFEGAGVEAMLLNPDSGTAQEGLGEAMAESLRGLLAAHRDEIRHPDPMLAVDFSVRALVALGRELASLPDQGRPGHSREALLGEVALSQLRYLAGGGDPDADREPRQGIDPFDIWG